MALQGKHGLGLSFVVGLLVLGGCDKTPVEIKPVQKDVPVRKPFVLATIESVRLTASETFDKQNVRIKGSNVISGAKLSLEHIITEKGHKISGDYLTTRTEYVPKCEFKRLTTAMADELKVAMSIPKFNEAYDKMLSVDGNCSAMERFMSDIEKLSVNDDDYRLFALTLEKLYTKENVSRTFTEVQKTALLKNGSFSLSFVLTSYPNARPTTAVFHLHANDKVTPLEFGLNSTGRWEGEKAWDIYSNEVQATAPPDKSLALAQRKEEEQKRLRENQARAEEEKRRIALERVRYVKENSDSLLLEILSTWDGSKRTINNDQVEKGLEELLQAGDPAAWMIARTIYTLDPTIFENLKSFVSTPPEDLLAMQKKLEQLSDSGKLTATIALALLHQSRLHPSIAVDDNKCISLLNRAKEKSIASASYFIAEILRNKSQRSETDLRYAMDMLKESASAGSAIALYKLGHLAETEEKNLDSALKYYRAAADKNHGLSQLRSAQLLAQIQPQDKNTITELLKRACNNNVGEAFYVFGEQLTKSTLSEDRLRGWELLEKAADKGVKPAGVALAQYWVDNRKKDRYVKAFRYATQSAADINTSGILTLGKMHFYALGVRSNKTLGIGLIEDSAMMGNSEAMFLLYDLYTNGKGVDPNPTLGLQWLAKATRAGYMPALEVVKAKKINF